MNLIRLVIRRKVFISMLFIGITALGYISYKQLPVELLPNTELPVLIVQVAGIQEMDPNYLEKQAIIPLESAISTLESIEKIESYVQRQQGMIFIYFNQNTRVKYAYLKLQEKVDAVKPTLASEFFVNVFKIDTEQITNMFMSLQVLGGGGVDRVRQVVDQKVLRELEAIDGLASVQVYGGRQKSVEIILDEQAGLAYGVNAARVRSLIGQNVLNKTFLGQVYERDRQYFVNLVAEYTNVHELENIIIRPDGPIYLKNLAQIFVGTKEPTSLSRVNGKEDVTIQLVRDAQVNLIALSHAVRATIARLNAELKDQDIEIIVQSDTAEEMEKNIDLIIQLALVGGLLAILVLFFFLRNLRLVVIIALAIPISVLTTFNFFYVNDISVNILTLIGMTLAVGMLLDNSVVVLENIYRLASQGNDLETAVVQGTSEVWRSIFAATLTTVTVFLPFVFSNKFIIKIVGRSVGVPIIVTLLVSLVVALLLIPMITHSLLARGSHRSLQTSGFIRVSPTHRLVQIYNLLLKSCMRFPIRTILTAILLFFISILLALALNPPATREVESDELKIYVTMPGGATLENTDVAVTELEKRLENVPEKDRITSQINEEEAIITVKLKEDYIKIKNRDLAEIKSDISKRIKDLPIADAGFDPPRASRRFRGGAGPNPGAELEQALGLGSQQEKIVVKGQDFEMMRTVANDIQGLLEDMAAIESTDNSVPDDRPEIQLFFDRQLLSQYDIPLTVLASELLNFQNEISSGFDFKIGSESYDIIIRNQHLETKTIDDLRLLPIQSQAGGVHELQSLSRIIYGHGHGGLNRLNQEKYIEITYKFLPDIASSKSLLETYRAEIETMIASLKMPAGIAVELIKADTGLDEFYFLIGAAAMLIFMILAAVFESFWLPVVIMFTIPLAAIGSFLGLILTDNSLFNVNSLIGLLILLGVVVNNGIIYIDYTRILRRRGFNRARALIMAGHARVRPILITSITTTIALMPLAMGKAEYVTSIGAPFAITVIGGLSLSTLFTLVFIPTVYSGLETMLEWIKKLSWPIKIIQLAAFVGGCLLIYFNVYSLIWRLANLALLILLILGLTWFIKASLRRARAQYIQDDEPLVIKIQNLVKIYDASSRFVREWQKGRRIRQRSGDGRGYFSFRDFAAFVWQLPLFGFLIYFVYFYLRSGFWLFLLAHGVYFYVFVLWRPVENYLHNRFGARFRILDRILQGGYPALLWGLPLLHLILFYFRWHKLALVIIIAVFWYLALTIYTTSKRLHEHKVNIMRLSGRLAGLRRAFYRLVQIIPIIGRRRSPFRALDRVSLEIGSGMFGLLGPNGAGKTTLMRIICGILEPSRGKVWINGIDANQKREELQGLIGYLPQEFGTYEGLTAVEFLNYQAILRGIYNDEQRRQIVDYAIGAVHLTEHQHQKIGTFSGGMKQRIGIAQTLLHLPRILVVDEPTAGLDPRERIRFRNLLVELSRERVVIFSTHIIEDISSSCNKVAVLNHGQLCYLGEPSEMTRLALGHVWQFFLAPEEFESRRKDFRIVHHMRVGERIRLRCLAEIAPVPDAIPVRPTLEDAYLWLLQSTGA